MQILKKRVRPEGEGDILCGSYEILMHANTVHEHVKGGGGGHREEWSSTHLRAEKCREIW